MTKKLPKKVLERLVKYDNFLDIMIDINKKHLSAISGLGSSEIIAQSKEKFNLRLDDYTNVKSQLYGLFPELPDYKNKIKTILTESVDNLELSIRAHNLLRSSNIRTIGDIVRYSESDFVRLRNVGEKSLAEIKIILNEHNLSFGMDINAYLTGGEQ